MKIYVLEYYEYSTMLDYVPLHSAKEAKAWFLSFVDKIKNEKTDITGVTLMQYDPENNGFYEGATVADYDGHMDEYNESDLWVELCKIAEEE